MIICQKKYSLVISSGVGIQLTSSNNPSYFTTPTTLTVTVADPTIRTVYIYDGVTFLGAFSVTAGVASTTINNFSVGTHNLTATYTAGPTSAPVAQVVATLPASIWSRATAVWFHNYMVATYGITSMPTDGQMNIPSGLGIYFFGSSGAFFTNMYAGYTAYSNVPFNFAFATTGATILTGWIKSDGFPFNPVGTYTNPLPPGGFLASYTTTAI